MNTLIIVASLFSLQPAATQPDNQWFDVQSMREQVRAYVVEDVASVSHVIYSALREGISVGSRFAEHDNDAATLVAQDKQAEPRAKPSKSQVN